MPYKHILQAVVDKTPKAVGAILVDWEGEAVQEYCHCDQYQMRFIAAHKGIILSRMREIQTSSNGGIIEDILISASKHHILIGVIDKDYSLVMLVSNETPASIALRNFRESVCELKKEF